MDGACFNQALSQPLLSIPTALCWVFLAALWTVYFCRALLFLAGLVRRTGPADCECNVLRRARGVSSMSMTKDETIVRRENRFLPSSRALAFITSPCGRADGEAWRRVSTSALYANESLRIYQGTACEGDLLGSSSGGAQLHAIKCSAPFPAPVHHVVASVRELDLMPTWNRFALFGKILADWAPTHVRAGCLLWTPSPFPRARMLIDAQLHDELDELGCVLIEATSPSPQQPEAGLPAELQHVAHLPVHVIATATPIVPARKDGTGAPHEACECELVVFLPASMLPGWVLRFALYLGFPIVYRAAAAMLASAALAGSALDQRVRTGAQRELYASLAKRCDEHLERKLAGRAHTGVAAESCSPLAPVRVSSHANHPTAAVMSSQAKPAGGRHQQPGLQTQTGLASHKERCNSSSGERKATSGSVHAGDLNAPPAPASPDLRRAATKLSSKT